MASVEGVTPTKGDSDGIPYRQAPSIAGGYGVMRGYGDRRNRHWRGRCQRGLGGPPPPPTGPVAWGPPPPAWGTTPATGMGTATASARTLSSVPSLLTGSVSREVTADAVDAANDEPVSTALARGRLKTSCRLVCQDILQGRIGVWLQ
jgi:hypothetical protein